jgi:hypothetical protein
MQVAHSQDAWIEYDWYDSSLSYGILFDTVFLKEERFVVFVV